MTAYSEYVRTKQRATPQAGFEAVPVPDDLFEHQRAIVEWACRMGRCAIFADTGLGKTLMQLEWARQVADHTGGRVLILAPLAVKEQTFAEAERFGIVAGTVGSQAPVHVINYHRLHQLDPSDYVGVVLDESSILKAVDGKTRTALIEAFAGTGYRLACTATPAPNDFTELGNHAEFLGVCTRAEMLSQYFVHDGGSTQDWRLKGHAVKEFWRWVASWSVMMRKPSDLGIDDNRYDLPPLEIRDVVVPMPRDFAREQGKLFTVDAQTLTEQRAVRRMSLVSRCEAVAAQVAAHPDDQWLIWCELNDESSALTAAIPGATEVAGAHSEDQKTERLLGFVDGSVRILVSKPKIAGFGMNFQGCHRMAFVGATHSYEQWYQAVRRCWRFGQTSRVDVSMIRTDADGTISANLRRKADAADQMAREMVAMVSDVQLEALFGKAARAEDQPTQATNIPGWLIPPVSEDS